MRKLKAVLAGSALIVLSVLSLTGARVYEITRDQQTEGGDSLLAAAVETTSVSGVSIPQYNSIAFVSCTDESVTILVQLSPDGTNWFNFATLETIPATKCDSVVMGDLAQYGGYKYRLIIDDIEATDSEYSYFYMSLK